ncbi:hypothetical protein NG895_22550 [Aeoliella sp. ICT_H6.2]|uniref:Uncharacterized protein n=1 Tax=Aeoliella straminimaris TaxID=2954799 RepID=A0A9X2FI22_9BACT|nr:hypothetical protein [Aeoliella straminimaris]MCO6046686.1 hypothetical protein [Aeoliella straminimaris]
MPTDRESPNPFASPQTVSTGDAKSPPRELGPRLRDLKHEAIGFAVLALTGVVAFLVAAGLLWFAMGAQESWMHVAIHALGIPLAALGVITAIVCGLWAIRSALLFAFFSRIGRGPAKEDHR